MAMETKQKVILGLTIVAFGYLGYQLYELISHDLASTANIQKAGVQHAAQAQASAGKISPNVIAPHANKTTVATPATESYEPTTLIHVTQKPEPVKLVRNQQAYMMLLNQYEIAKMKRQLLDEQVAIAQAEQHLAKLHHQTGNYGAQDTTHNEFTSMSDGFNSPGYELNFLDNQQGRWQATISNGGNYETVSVGDPLPDGFKVIKINNRGVELQNDKQRELITFLGVIKEPLPKPPLPPMMPGLQITPPPLKIKAIKPIKLYAPDNIHQSHLSKLQPLNFSLAPLSFVPVLNPLQVPTTLAVPFLKKETLLALPKPIKYFPNAYHTSKLKVPNLTIDIPNPQTKVVTFRNVTPEDILQGYDHPSSLKKKTDTLSVKQLEKALNLPAG